MLLGRYFSTQLAYESRAFFWMSTLSLSVLLPIFKECFAMATLSLFSAFWLLVSIAIMLFHLLQLIKGCVRMSLVAVENEGSHAIMAIGMVYMLSPTDFLTSHLLHWSMLLFAITCLWWICRLFTRKPLLAILLGKNGEASSFLSDAIHVFMHGGMLYMFFLMNRMSFSMTQPAISTNSIFFASFTFLALVYSREISKDLQTTKLNWEQLGANVAHLLMSGMMGWMFLEMISMSMSMGIIAFP
jgi:uncharacterized protein DUF5134